MSNAATIVAVCLVGISISVPLLVLRRRYAAERMTVGMPDGRRFDILVNREGVPLYVWYGRYAPLLGWIREKRRGPLPWVVRVRQSPYRGYKDLVHETYPNLALARSRALEISDDLRQGQRLWPAEWQW